MENVKLEQHQEFPIQPLQQDRELSGPRTVLSCDEDLQPWHTSFSWCMNEDRFEKMVVNIITYNIVF